MLLKLLRSTKWNASLILLRDCAELVALCKVIVWKKDAKMSTLLIFAGARHGIVIRDLKIPRRDELGRLPEVNLLNRACAEEL